MTSATDAVSITATAAPSAPDGAAAPVPPTPSKVDPITAVQDSIDGLALSLFEALRGVRDAVAVAPEALAAPGAKTAPAAPAPTAFLPDAPDELEKEATATDRLLNGVNAEYFPPRAFDLLDPDYDAFLMACVSEHPYAREMVAMFAADSKANAVGPPGTVATDTADLAATIHIGDVGYEFRKKFDAGWYKGKVAEIRPLAANGYDRRCVFTDGDIEDLRVDDLERLATLDPNHEKHRRPAKAAARPPAGPPAGQPGGVAFPRTPAQYARLLRDAEHARDVRTTRTLAGDIGAKSRAVDDLVANLPGMDRTRRQQMGRIDELIKRNHAVTRALEEAHGVARARREEVRARLGESTCAALGVEEETC